jgi:hypothetical protein
VHVELNLTEVLAKTTEKLVEERLTSALARSDQSAIHELRIDSEIDSFFRSGEKEEI